MNESTFSAQDPAPSKEDLTLLPPTLEELAREDAAVDRQLSEALWYPQFKVWAQIGVITDEEWQRYRVAYFAASGHARPTAT